jgi:predicted peptidase
MKASPLGPLTGLLIGLGSLQTQAGETGFLNRTLSHQGEAHRYQVYVPADYSAAKAWPVILFLHGAGERGQDGLRSSLAGLGPAIRNQAARFPAIVVFPQIPPGQQWAGPQSELALAALKQTQAEFHTDPSRVYLTGLSMGGHGAWYLAYRHPERFAAVAPICGWVGELPALDFRASVVPPEDGPPLEALKRRLAGLPLWIFHGERDPIVPVAASREPARALGAGSGNVHYTEFPGLEHNAWDAAFSMDAFVQWLFAQRQGAP